MTTKLNLTIEEKNGKKNKSIRGKKKTSVSKITEEYFSRLTEENGKKRKSFVEEWAGFLTEPIGDIDKAKDKYLKEKYGL